MKLADAKRTLRLINHQAHPQSGRVTAGDTSVRRARERDENENIFRTIEQGNRLAPQRGTTRAIYLYTNSPLLIPYLGLSLSPLI